MKYTDFIYCLFYSFISGGSKFGIRIHAASTARR